MLKSKFAALAASAGLVASLGLVACGGQAAKSSSSAASSSSEATSAASSSSEAASSSAATADDQKALSWEGVLEDGSLVSYAAGDDSANAALSVTPAKTGEQKTWMGAATGIADGKVTITDDTTKETITFTLTNIMDYGTMDISIDGYGKGMLFKMTAADWKKAAELEEEFNKNFVIAVNWVGVLENGSAVTYAASDDATKAALSVTPLGSEQAKTWSGAATGTEGKVTITDDATKEAVTFTLGTEKEDGTMEINVEGHGKGTLMKMTEGSYKLLEEIEKGLASLSSSSTK